MSTHTSASSTPSLSNLSLSSYNPSNHIDLTLEDSQDASSDSYGRFSKRQRTELPPPRRSQYQQRPDAPSAFVSPDSSISAAPPVSSMSTFTSYNRKPAVSMPDTSSMNSSHMQGQHNYLQPSYRPAFAGPSSPAFYVGRQQRPTPTPSPSFSSKPPPISSYPDSYMAAPKASNRHVIDLTGSPSPPPLNGQQQSQTQSNLPPNLPPKTPVCIGQLGVTALVLCPIPYLLAQESGNNESNWATIRLQYEHNPTPSNPTGETIHLFEPPTRAPNGETIQGERFGVIEQKVASFVGPMLGKGLIRLDAKVKRGLSALPILPMHMLVYTPKGNIPVVGNYLHQCGLFLDHPTPPYDIQQLGHYHYYNPHNPPPGGHNPVIYPPSPNRWAPVTSGKSVEVQRSQVDELFKSLKNGDELAETEPSPDVATKLYPHQKKALTFLLEREREKPGPDGEFSSLWQARINPISRQQSWFHLVTHKEIFQEPNESKGSILADDMGLGKTITCVSLIAATLASSREFASTPIPPLTPPSDHTAHDQYVNPSHFSGSVWGMPEEGGSAKSKAKAARTQERLEATYTRASRIKAKSRATLIICPLSTVSNWEDQFREHWQGEVTVVGGGGGSACGAVPPPTPSQPSITQHMSVDVKKETKPGRIRRGTPLRIYIYHGNSRRPDPTFLADFDAVITTYATLASEFSKQNRSVTSPDADDDDDDNSSDGAGGVDIDDHGNQVLRLPKPKKAGLKRKKSSAFTGNGAAEASSALQSINWFRVVLDEAHSIKETGTVGSRACCDLMADRRLCLTGTPVQNKLDDVFALIKFLRLDPFDDKNIWTEFIGSPVKFGQPLGVARLQTIMMCITLRRTKETKAPDGNKILALPPRRDELRYLKFDAQEQEIYDQFFNESKAEFNEMSNKNEVMKNYVGILQKILRLRQICDHFELVEGKGPGGASQDSATSYEEIVAAIEKDGINVSRATAIFALLRESATTQCVECGGELCTAGESAQGDNVDMEGSSAPKRGRKSKSSASRGPTRANSPSAPHPVLTRCQHLFCLECYRNCICPGWPNVAPETRRSCTACQTGLRPADAVEIRSDCTVEAAPKKKTVKREKRQKGSSLDSFHPSTKVKALLGDLVQFSRTNPHSANYDPSSIEVQMVDDQGNAVDEGCVKTVVFSQWTSMLDKIEDALEAAGIRYDRLDGTMKRDDRTRAMDALKHDPGCEVLLVSLKAGGVGLNLTAAQRVYLMDPYWNPAVENQAVDRIHRLGQTRPVTTVKLIIENSIEARLLEVQKKKTELANMTLGQNFSKAELMQRRVEELNQLLS